MTKRTPATVPFLLLVAGLSSISINRCKSTANRPCMDSGWCRRGRDPLARLLRGVRDCRLNVLGINIG